MGKIVKLFIILLCCINLLQAQDKYEKHLQKFDRVYKNLNESQMLKYHHSLKNIYIKSIINNDIMLKIKTLQRLLISSSALGLSSKAYQKELNTLVKMAGKKGSKIKILKNKSTKSPKKQGRIKIYKPKQYIKPKPNVSSLFQDDNQIPKILKVKPSNTGLSLEFNKNTDEVKIKYFLLRGKKNGKYYYKFVYDIDCILTSKAKIYHLKNVKIQINQYNKKVVRIVFNSDKRLKLNFTKEDFFINIVDEDIAPKTQIKPRQKPKKTSTMLKKIIKTSRYKPTNKIIVIDAGHGGKDGGAQGAHGLSEKKIALQVALKLGKELKSRGYKLYFTRTRDKFIQLRSRTKMANKKLADLFISIHANAAPNRAKYKSMHGVETFFLSPARSKRSKRVAALENKSDIAEMDYFSKQTLLNFLNHKKIVASNKLALDIQQAMLNSIQKKYKVIDDGVREAPFWVLVGAQMPAALVEIGYITNPIEGKRLAQKNYQNLLATGIANGIDSYFINNN